MSQFEFGYTLEKEALNLFCSHENRIHLGINQKNKQVDLLVDRMEQLEHFLSIVAAKTDDSGRLDLTNAEDQALVDKIRGYEELGEHVFPHGKYVWKEKEIEDLTRRVENYIQGSLQRKISITSEEIVLDQHDLNKTLEIFKGCITRMNNLIERILGNIQRGH